MPVEHRGRQVRHEIILSAPPERVWALWTEPAQMLRWLATAAEGSAALGGVMQICLDGSSKAEAWRVVLAEPGSRLAFEHSGVGGPTAEPNLLEVDIQGVGGQTRVTLIHSGFAEGPRGAEWYDAADSAWELRLALLKEHLEHHDGCTRHFKEALLHASFTYEQALDHFLDGSTLAGWLTADGGIGMPGEPVRLALQDGHTLSGETLAVTPREVALRWTELGGVLLMRAGIRIPGGRTISLQLSSWKASDEQLERCDAFLKASISRLKGSLACAPLTSGVF